MLKKEYNKEFIEAIGEENLDKVKALIKEISGYFQSNNINPGTVKIFYFNLMGDIFNDYDSFLENDKNIMNYEQYHYEIENSECLSNINCLFMDLASKVIDKISHTKYNNSKIMINKVLNYLQCHFYEKISLKDVADNMNVSKHYLCSMFKKETGENMSLYINKLRIDKAKKMLLESDSKIKEIFEEVGYSNQEYFSKVFKKITGMTIMEYRESKLNK